MHLISSPQSKVRRLQDRTAEIMADGYRIGYRHGVWRGALYGFAAACALAFGVLVVREAAAAEIATIKFVFSPSVASSMIECQKMTSQALGTPVKSMRDLPHICMYGGAMAAAPTRNANGDLVVEHVCVIAAREPTDLDDTAALNDLGHEVWAHCLRGIRHQ